MSNTNTGGPAFPSPYDDDEGMTLRDYFAAKAMHGMISANIDVNGAREDLAREAYKKADAMIKAREA